jgi:hypothetical protein
VKIIPCVYRDLPCWHLIQCNCRLSKLFNQRYFWWVSWPSTILWILVWKGRKNIEACLWLCSKLIARIFFRDMLCFVINFIHYIYIYICIYIYIYIYIHLPENNWLHLHLLTYPLPLLVLSIHITRQQIFFGSFRSSVVPAMYRLHLYETSWLVWQSNLL